MKYPPRKRKNATINEPKISKLFCPLVIELVPRPYFWFSAKPAISLALDWNVFLSAPHMGQFQSSGRSCSSAQQSPTEEASSSYCHIWQRFQHRHHHHHHHYDYTLFHSTVGLGAKQQFLYSTLPSLPILAFSTPGICYLYVLNLMSNNSFHVFIGLPRLALPATVPNNICLGSLSSVILAKCPSHVRQ
jgi:hypothetical protein